MAKPAASFKRIEPIGIITMERPPANSYEIGFIRDLDSAISTAIGDAEVKVAILRSGLDKFFSAGADIKSFAAKSSDENMDMIRASHKTLDKMASSDTVFIAMIQGHALGGGLEIALACDLRFAASGRYRIGLPEVTLGMLPGNGGTQRLPRLIGLSRALDLMLTGETLSPKAALEIGIVNRLFPRASIEQETKSYARKLAGGATLAMARIKQAAYQGSDMKLRDALALERHLARPLLDTKDAREGLEAFIEKRPPTFQGH